VPELAIGDAHRLVDPLVRPPGLPDDVQGVDHRGEGVAELMSEHRQELVLARVGLLSRGQPLDLRPEALVGAPELLVEHTELLVACLVLVEDNRDAREMLRAVLELQGHVVSDTGDGVAAVRLATQVLPDVVILDIGLPGVDGFETARRIRRRLGERVRLVAVSGYGDDETRERGRGAGFDAHLVKPVSPEALSQTLDAL
jgi:CheY-like chemotaxis protein